MCTKPNDNDYEQENLIKQFQEGHRKIENHFYKAFKPTTINYCKNIIADAGMAESIFLEGFQKLLQLRQRFDSIPNMKAFLLKTARNAAFNHIRFEKSCKARYKEMALLQEKEYTPYDEHEQMKVLEIVQQMITQLPQRRKLVLQRSFIEQQNDETIAAELKMSIQTVRTTRRDALQDLRKRLLAKTSQLPESYTIAIRKRMA